LIGPPLAGKIERIITAASLTPTLRRSLIALLLVAVALAPAVSRAHLRLSTHPTPAQDNSRFKWSNSCGHVPSRPPDERLPLISAVPAAVAADRSPCHHAWLEADVVQITPAFVSLPSLRAPPTLLV
jgi:hypothetical protein